jgi:chromosome segregation ATPase
MLSYLYSFISAPESEEDSSSPDPSSSSSSNTNNNNNTDELPPNNNGNNPLNSLLQASVASRSDLKDLRSLVEGIDHEIEGAELNLSKNLSIVGMLEGKVRGIEEEREDEKEDERQIEDGKGTPDDLISLKSSLHSLTLTTLTQQYALISLRNKRREIREGLELGEGMVSNEVTRVLEDAAENAAPPEFVQ